MDVGRLGLLPNSKGHVALGFLGGMQQTTKTHKIRVWDNSDKRLLEYGCTRWRGLLKHCATSRNVALSIASLRFLLSSSFQPHYGPGFDSASKRNEYQWYLLGEWRGVKAYSA
jgi:hypothetical protein